MPERPWLHKRIERRLGIMWNEGLVAEVIGLLEQYPLTPNLPSMRCVGYRQVLEYLVHINHPIFEQAHLDKAQFYDAFDAVDDSISDQSKPQIQATEHIGQAEALACQQMQNKALYATRQLAKRQYTWLRKLTQLSDLSGDVPNDDKQIDNAITIKTFDTMAQVRDYLY